MCRWEEFRNHLREEVVEHRDDTEVEFMFASPVRG
jgi:hypothetical protein